MVNFKRLIRKKRDGKELTEEELEDIVEGSVSGEMEPAQIGAWLMAVYLNNLSETETYELTKKMARSGRTLDFSSIEGFRVDKHSTGGVGDHVSLILLPLVATCGLKIGKLSGRALGHTGGTIDKAESIPGFRVDPGIEEMKYYVKRSGLALMEHTKELVPADHLFYQLRDRTAALESIPLITSSVMSKKLAANPGGLVLDVKVGSGAFIKRTERAEKLVRSCLSIGKKEGIKTSALVTDMNGPLGKNIGDALAVKEVIKVLKNERSGRLIDLSVSTAAELLLQSGNYYSEAEAEEKLRKALQKGEALGKFREMVENQGGDPKVVENPDILPSSSGKAKIRSEESGYVKKIDPLLVAEAADLAENKAENKPDHSAGTQLEKEIGDRVEEGETLAVLHYNRPGKKKKAAEKLKKAFSLTESPGEATERPLVKSIHRDF